MRTVLMCKAHTHTKKNAALSALGPAETLTQPRLVPDAVVRVCVRVCVCVCVCVCAREVRRGPD